MKKTYFAPQTDIIEVKIEAVLGTESYSEQTVGTGSSGNGVNYSREDSDWDE